ncbi:RCC1 domain-containing protein [Myxococcus fulvus]|uniref:RCC1 domain-containing protein n=1 Tax=Myxococcus fulvus TaxID=33 RepID=UPI001479169A|nr:RCC1 repeat-containing protein [Myxococcus fulvus]
MGLLLSVGCGQQEPGAESRSEDSQSAAISRTRPRVKLAANENHSLAIRANGTVWASGRNFAGVLGREDISGSATPLEVPGLTGALSVAAGSAFSMALRSGGTVWTWGQGVWGQLGSPDYPAAGATRATPAQVPGLEGVVAIAAGSTHALALKGDGTVWAWGLNSNGQLGTGASGAQQNTPVQVSGLANVAAVFARGATSFAIRSDGTLWGWGSNEYAVLGSHLFPDQSAFPRQVPGLTNVVAVSQGLEHVLAVKSDSTVWTWGMKDPGIESYYVEPVQVAGLTGVVDVAAGTNSSYAIKSNGTVWSWGENTHGQLGDGTKQRRPNPILVPGLTGVSTLAAGATHVLALRGDGSIWSWGSNYKGELGDGVPMNTATPALVQDANVTGALAVAAGHSHSLLLQSDGTVWSWGDNEAGQLGDGTRVRRIVPAQVPTLQDITAIAAAGQRSLALRVDGTVWAWGKNTLVPTRVPGLENVTAISTSLEHSLALRDDATVWAWGTNTEGQLGDGTLTSRTTPVKVLTLTNVMKISATNYNSYAITYDGSAWAWGYNGYGQVGDGTTTLRRSTPVRIPGLSNVVAIAGGSYHGMAVLVDGSGWSWGVDYRGAGMSLFTNANRLVPRPMYVTGLFDVVSSESMAVATTFTGTAWARGTNTWGQVGDGTTDFLEEAIQVQGITSGVTSIALGDRHTLAIHSDGTLWSWGNNSDGQLARGQAFDTLLPAPSLLD